MFASKGLVARRESRKRRRKRAREKGGRRVAPRLDLEGELKIVSNYERRGIDCRSIYYWRVRERRVKEVRGPRLSEERNGIIQRPFKIRPVPVLFPEVAPSDGQLWMLKIQLRGIYGCRRWAYLLSHYPLL